MSTTAKEPIGNDIYGRGSDILTGQVSSLASNHRARHLDRNIIIHVLHCPSLGSPDAHLT